ncbi:MAG TPA: hypothetical protein VJY62_19740 [Bacteroidia bacterium]|nr:hypothetical protein [Bacteroidia bacterium]
MKNVYSNPVKIFFVRAASGKLLLFVVLFIFSGFSLHPQCILPDSILQQVKIIEFPPEWCDQLLPVVYDMRKNNMASCRDIKDYLDSNIRGGAKFEIEVLFGTKWVTIKSCTSYQEEKNQVPGRIDLATEEITFNSDARYSKAKSLLENEISRFCFKLDSITVEDSSVMPLLNMFSQFLATRFTEKGDIIQIDSTVSSQVLLKDSSYEQFTGLNDLSIAPVVTVLLSDNDLSDKKRLQDYNDWLNTKYVAEMSSLTGLIFEDMKKAKSEILHSEQPFESGQNVNVKKNKVNKTDTVSVRTCPFLNSLPKENKASLKFELRFLSYKEKTEVIQLISVLKSICPDITPEELLIEVKNHLRKKYDFVNDAMVDSLVIK